MTEKHTDIDNGDSREDSFIEAIRQNRAPLTAIADFIRMKIEDGLKKKDIATLIGKSPTFVTQYTKLLDLPEPVERLFRSGECKDLIMIDDMIKIYRVNPDALTRWLNEKPRKLTRKSVKDFRKCIDSGEYPDSADTEMQVDFGKEDVAVWESEPDIQVDFGKEDVAVWESEPDIDLSDVPATPMDMKSPVILCKYGARAALLVYTRRSSSITSGWVRFEDSGEEREVDLCDLRIMQIMNGSLFRFSGSGGE